MPDLDILIPTWERPDALTRCLESIRSTQAGYDVRVFTDEGPETITKKFNRMAKDGDSPLVMFANDDIEFLSGTIPTIIRGMSDRTIGMGLVFFAEPTSRPCSANLLMGEMFVLRRDVGEDIGWCDEQFEHYMSDIDILWKCKQAGIDVEPLLGACVFHHRVQDEHRKTKEASRKDHDTFTSKWEWARARVDEWFPNWETGLHVLCPLHGGGRVS